MKCKVLKLARDHAKHTAVLLVDLLQQHRREAREYDEDTKVEIERKRAARAQQQRDRDRERKVDSTPMTPLRSSRNRPDANTNTKGDNPSAFNNQKEVNPNLKEAFNIFEDVVQSHSVSVSFFTSLLTVMNRILSRPALRFSDYSDPSSNPLSLNNNNSTFNKTSAKTFSSANASQTTTQMTPSSSTTTTTATSTATFASGSTIPSNINSSSNARSSQAPKSPFIASTSRPHLRGTKTTDPNSKEKTNADVRAAMKERMRYELDKLLDLWNYILSEDVRDGSAVEVPAEGEEEEEEEEADLSVDFGLLMTPPGMFVFLFYFCPSSVVPSCCIFRRAFVSSSCHFFYRWSAVSFALLLLGMAE
jgi:hypothetical protein